MTVNHPTRVTKLVEPWFEKAFALHALGERVTWEIMFGMAQDQAGNVLPLLQLFSQIPGAQLGSAHMDLAQIHVHGIDEDRVTDAGRGAVDRMMEARSQTLAAGNGHKPGGGLILP
jgi:hypothetical protein